MKRYNQPVNKKEDLEIDIYENFEGSKTELFFLKLFRAIFEYKKIILFFFLLIVCVLTAYSLFIQNEQKKFQTATLENRKS